jgi:hypothetical protein
MITINIKRLRDINAVRVTSKGPTPINYGGQFVRGLDRLMLVSTHIPDEHQRSTGALLALLLRGREEVDNIDLVYTNAGYWFATAVADYDGTLRRYRGEGMSAEEAVISLISEIEEL